MVIKKIIIKKIVIIEKVVIIGKECDKKDYNKYDCNN